jgi:hypothetical protein
MLAPSTLPYILFIILFIIWLWIWTTSQCDNMCWPSTIWMLKCMALCMWVMNNFVPMCNVHGYEKSSNCLTPWYTLVCHYSRRWILALSL